MKSNRLSNPGQIQDLTESLNNNKSNQKWSKVIIATVGILGIRKGI
ncbi:MAG: hypothetical protein WA395_09180 [Nitrososphaeraceae archaeon]